MALVTIPTAFRSQTNNQALIELEGDSIREVLEALARRFPELGKRLFKSEGELNRFVNFYLNDEDIRFLESLDTPLSAGDEIAIIPAIAGGLARSKVSPS